MHGRLKVKEKSEIELEKKKKYEEKAAKFKKGLDLCLKSKANTDYNDEVMRITWDLVALNPDVYTIWNMRKEYITNKKQQFDKQLEELRNKINEQKKFSDELKKEEEENSNMNDDQTIESSNGKSSSINENDESIEPATTITEDELIDQFQKLCNDELELTEYALLKNSKSYSAWQHRLWILTIIPIPNFKREFQVNEAYLQKDGRNLHCWHYRTNLCNISGRSLEDEIKFSLDKIKDNLSAFSYSTLYYRSLTLTKASNSGLINFSKCWPDEYSLVENALFTEPNDQALWFYLRWLLLTNFGQCLSLADESKSNETSRLVKIVFNKKIKLLMFHFDRIVKHFPFVHLKIDSISITGDRLKTLKYRPSKMWFVDLANDSGIDDENLNELHLNEELKLKFRKFDNYLLWTNDDMVDESSEFKKNELKMRIRNEQLESLLTLRQLEPNNKWLNLILSYFENTDQIQILDDLIRLDPLRTNYYQDQKSKIKLEKLISNLKPDQSALDLINQQLTVLYTPEPFAHLTMLNLTGNRITCLSTNWNCLISLQTLIMDDNQLYRIQRNFTLPNLHEFSLRNNKLSKHSAINNLTNCPKLKLLHLFGNNLSEDEDLNELIMSGIICDLNN